MVARLLGWFFGLSLGAVLAQAAHAAEPRFAPLPDKGELIVRVGVGSCADQNLPQPIWRAVAEEHPNLFLMIGDNVYGDVSSAEMTELEAAYATLRAHGDFAPFARETPMLTIWDDHDYGLNDGGGDFPHRARAERIFLDAWEIGPDDPRRARPGLYHAQTFGPEGLKTQIILLDTRSFRSPLKKTDKHGAPGRERYLPDSDPYKTLLGEAQWAWLEDRLREPAHVRLIVSSIQVVADGHGWEGWHALPAERDRLYALIRDTDARGVVLLSGDRHIGGLYRRDIGAAYPIHELTASSLNRPNMRYVGEAGPHRLGDAYRRENFGVIVIDWYQRRLRLELKDKSGDTVRNLEIAFSELGF